MESVNPATGETIDEYDDHDEADVDASLDRAASAFEAWSDRRIDERQRLVDGVADVLREKEDEYASLMTREMGKPIKQARSEIRKCAWVCEYYGEHARQHLQDEAEPGVPHAETKVSYEPLGPVLAVMPWNFPFWQAFRFAAPGITAGNVGLLKHSSLVPGCALAIEEAFHEAGVPEGVFQTLLVDSERTEGIIEDDRVRAVTLTGSVGAGRAVGEAAGRNLKKTVLELGGSDPFVVLDDADLDVAAQVGAWARNQNAGQSCIAAKRFVVADAVHDEFVEKFGAACEALDVGDPESEDVDVGPQASAELMEGLHEQVEATVDAGAEAVLGGEPLDHEGAYYPPTILTDVPEGSPADEEELFGPVASIFRVPDEAAAVEKANDTQFGLGASVWTGDRERGERIARRIDAGNVFVNELVKSDPRLPFGGVKNSGYGRELSKHGIREFVNRKTIWIQDAGDAADTPSDAADLTE